MIILGKGNYMQVNGIKSYSASNVAFAGEGSEKKGINKKVAIGAGIGAAAVAAGTIAYAAKRGKLVTPEGTKFFAKVKEGFKTFAGENRLKYLETLKANLEDLVKNGKKGKDGAVQELSKEALEATNAKIKALGEKIESLAKKIAEKAAKAAEKTAEAAEKVAAE